MAAMDTCWKYGFIFTPVIVAINYMWSAAAQCGYNVLLTRTTCQVVHKLYAHHHQEGRHTKANVLLCTVWQQAAFS